MIESPRYVHINPLLKHYLVLLSIVIQSKEHLLLTSRFIFHLHNLNRSIVTVTF